MSAADPGTELAPWFVYSTAPELNEGAPRRTLHYLGTVWTTSSYREPSPTEIESALIDADYAGGEVFLIPSEKIVRYQAESKSAFSLAAIEEQLVP
jgi:hypothetical protein